MQILVKKDILLTMNPFIKTTKGKHPGGGLFVGTVSVICQWKPAGDSQKQIETGRCSLARCSATPQGDQMNSNGIAVP